MNYIHLISSLLLFFVGAVLCQTESIEPKPATSEETSTDALPLPPAKPMAQVTTGSSIASESAAQSTALSDSPDDTYVVRNGDKICILLKLDAKFSFYYNENQQKPEETTNIALQDDVANSGDCGSDAKLPNISLKWNSYELTFTFDNNSTNKRWFVKTIQFIVIPGKTPEIGKGLAATSKESELQISAPLNMSYECSKPETVKLYNENGSLIAYAVLENIQVQAFATSDGNFGTESPCSEKKALQDDSEIFYQSDTVPIAVGSTLAVVTILIVAAYGIYRSLFVKKVDYDTMED